MINKEQEEILINPSLLYLESLLQTLDTSIYDSDIRKQLDLLKNLVNKKIYQNLKFKKDIEKTEYKVVFYYKK